MANILADAAGNAKDAKANVDAAKATGKTALSESELLPSTSGIFLCLRLGK